MGNKYVGIKAEYSSGCTSLLPYILCFQHKKHKILNLFDKTSIFDHFFSRKINVTNHDFCEPINYSFQYHLGNSFKMSQDDML